MLKSLNLRLLMSTTMPFWLELIIASKLRYGLLRWNELRLKNNEISLFSNDIFSKYNDNQFLLLLRKCNKTKAGSMMMHLFKELQYNKKIQTTYEVKEINISTLDY